MIAMQDEPTRDPPAPTRPGGCPQGLTPESLGYVARRIDRERQAIPAASAEVAGELGRRAVLDAAGELLLCHGLARLTFDAVASRARVGRHSIERWWPTEEALALDVLHHEWLALAGHIRHGAREFGL